MSSFGGGLGYDPEATKELQKTTALTVAIKKLTWIIVGAAIIQILLAIPVAIEAVKHLLCR